MEIILFPQIGLLIFADIMMAQGKGDNQRQVTLTILFMVSSSSAFFVRGQVAFKIAHQMLQDIL